MLLALDVGNTHVVVGLMEGREVRRSFRIATRRDNAVGDYAVALSQLLELAEVDRREVEQVIISSVVPPVTRACRARTAADRKRAAGGGRKRPLPRTGAYQAAGDAGRGPAYRRRGRAGSVSAAAAAGRHGYRHHSDGAG